MCVYTCVSAPRGHLRGARRHAATVAAWDAAALAAYRDCLEAPVPAQLGQRPAPPPPAPASALRAMRPHQLAAALGGRAALEALRAAGQAGAQAQARGPPPGDRTGAGGAQAGAVGEALRREALAAAEAALGRMTLAELAATLAVRRRGDGRGPRRSRVCAREGSRGGWLYACRLVCGMGMGRAERACSAPPRRRCGAWACQWALGCWRRRPAQRRRA
jgi:hypothetical protein